VIRPYLDAKLLQDKLHEAHINLTEAKVERNVRMEPHVHAPNDPEEVFAIEAVVLKHPQVQAELTKLQLPAGTYVVCDPWIYGMGLVALQSPDSI
jgi:primary-amine oxidase